MVPIGVQLYGMLRRRRARGTSRSPCRSDRCRRAAASLPRPRCRSESIVAGNSFRLRMRSASSSQREADVRRRHRVVIGGQVLGRERVDVAADLLEEARVLLGRDVLRALEHHVLEHVRDAADADVLVLRSDVIEDLHRRDRRLVIGEEQHLEAVRQRPVLDVQLRRRKRGGRGGGGLRRLGRRGSGACGAPASSATAAGVSVGARRRAI